MRSEAWIKERTNRKKKKIDLSQVLKGLSMFYMASRHFSLGNREPQKILHRRVA